MASMQEKPIIALLLGLCPISTRQTFSYEVQHSFPVAGAVSRLDTRSCSVSDVSVRSDMAACLQGIFQSPEYILGTAFHRDCTDLNAKVQAEKVEIKGIDGIFHCFFLNVPCVFLNVP
jgi:hypothetical protein